MSPVSPAKTDAKTKPKRGTKPTAPDAIELSYSLAELPSAQHRAGLAGLVMMIRWLERQPGTKGTCKLTRVDEVGATLALDAEGLGALFDALYAADTVEAPKKAQWKDRSGAVIPPLRVEEVEVTDARGKVKKEKLYYYEVVVPKAGLLGAHEPPTANGATPWLKLWRDMLWETLRGVPAQRDPYDARAERRPISDAADTWADLSAATDPAVDLPSTYYLGAQARTADNVPFKDRARCQLLLHFWPYVAQVYVPQVVSSKDGKTEFAGYALAVPDVAALAAFCDELPGVLKQRGVQMQGFRPREAVIDLPAEGALDQARRLRERVAAHAGDRPTSYYVLGYDVFHLRKEGNSVRILGVWRVEPEERLIDAYIQLRGMKLWSPLFRRQRLENLLDGKPWFHRFDRLVETRPQDELTIGAPAFCRDARESFLAKKRETEANMTAERDAPSLEEVVYGLMQGYTQRRLKAKYGLELDEKTKKDPRKVKEYNERRLKMAKDAFLAVRSRTGADFVAYFAGTLCSVPQYLPAARYELITRALRDKEQCEQVRTLTLLALSAASWSPSAPHDDRQGATEE